MKCQSLFSWKEYFKMSSSKFAQRVIKAKIQVFISAASDLCIHCLLWSVCLNT